MKMKVRPNFRLDELEEVGSSIPKILAKIKIKNGRVSGEDVSHSHWKCDSDTGCVGDNKCEKHCKCVTYCKCDSHCSCDSECKEYCSCDAHRECWCQDHKPYCIFQ